MLVMVCGLIVSGVAINLLELFVVPVLLQKVAAQVPLGELVKVTFLSTLAMLAAYAAKSYLELNRLFGQTHLRINILNDIHKKFCTTSYPNVEDTGYIELCQKASNAVYGNGAATEMIWKTLTELAVNAVTFIVYLLLLTNIHPVVWGCTLITSVISYFLGRRIRKWRYVHKEEESRLHQWLHYIDTSACDVKLAKDIRIFGMGAWLQELWDKTLQTYKNFCRKSEKQNLLADFLDIALAFCRNAVAYGYLIWLAVEGKLSAAGLILYFTAIGGFTGWITGLLDGISVLGRQCMDISDVREYLDKSEIFCMENGEKPAFRRNHSYKIELQNVSFRYPDTEQAAIQNLSLTLHPEEKLAVVGINGAGKTTLVKLMCGFLDPSEGRVLLDGVDIKNYNRQDYYKIFSAVYQQFSVIPGTVAENVAQRMTDIDYDKVTKCLQEAGLMEKIASMPQGVYTCLGRQVYEDAAELSGGETQKLMLARALYKDGPVIVLDEPTAALDPIAERDIYMKYSEVTKGRSSIFISHRLASTRFCDRIILMENGSIVEEGDHDSLMNLAGKYAELFEIQSRYYREEGV